MAALQARLVFFALLGIAVAISYNALYLQNGSHPAPISSETRVGEGARKPVARKGETASRPSRDVPAGSSSSDTVRAIQRELGTRNYDPGPVDGVAGLLTRAAIMAYQHDHGLTVTGEASHALLERIVLGKSGRDGEQTAGGEMPKETIGLVKATQHVLAKLGYEPGPVDGIIGAGTRKAIEAFERERKLPATGRISGKLLREIMRVTGAKLSNLPSS